MFASGQPKKVAVTDDVGSIQSGDAEIKALGYGNGYGDAATREVVDEMTGRPKRRVTNADLRPSQFELDQITGKINLRCLIAERPEAQRFGLESRARKIKLRFR